MTPLLIAAILRLRDLMASARADLGVRGPGEGRDLLGSGRSESLWGAAPTMRALYGGPQQQTLGSKHSPGSAEH